MMTLKRFRKLTDSYGADLRRWPERLRPQGRALLECSAQAQEIIARARELDEAIAAAASARSESLWAGDHPEEALVRLRNSVAARIGPAGAPAAVAAVAAKQRSRRSARGTLWRVRWVSLATAASVAILAGIALGMMYTPAATHQDFLTLLQPGPIQLLDD